MPNPAAAPSQKPYAPPTPSTLSSSNLSKIPSRERDGLHVPNPAGSGAASLRNLSASAMAPRGASSLALTPSAAPGSFSSDLRSQMMPSRAGSRADILLGKLDEADDDDLVSAAEKTLSTLRDALKREMKIREGSENMLEALNSKKAKQAKDQRQRVEAELTASNVKIKDLRQRIADAQRAPAPRIAPTTPTRIREGLFQGNGLRSPPSASRSGVGSDMEEAAESPTLVLTELLQALEVGGLTPEYYVAKSNSLVDLFKKYPKLKYDLQWNPFGLRIQEMLLSDSREMVAAGYRMTRYAISDLASLKRIRSLNTDYMVVLSLIKDRKADVEREQALKFVRAFLDIKDGVTEVSRAIVRTIASVAGQDDDRLRPICIETLAEILVRDPQLLMASGGLAPLSEAMMEGSYKAPESLSSAILFLLDAPERRKYLKAGYELEVLFTAFTDPYNSNEAILRQNSKAIVAALKTWPGLIYMGMHDFRTIRSLISSLMLPMDSIKETVIDLIYSLLRIKSPSWATSFLAGRRLTTYGRVATMKSDTPKGNNSYVEDDSGEQNFVEHYTALLLAIFVKADLVGALLRLTGNTENQTLIRKSTLLIGEVLRLSSRLLPSSISDDLQLLPELFASAAKIKDDRHFQSSSMVYQISRVTQTLQKTSPGPSWIPASQVPSNGLDLAMLEEQPKGSINANVDETTFRQWLVDSGVLSSSNYAKWKWDIILRIIEGPLTVGKRFDEAMKASKFLKRLMSFYRPFKYKFSEIKTSRNTQRYVRAGCALFHTLLQTPQGCSYLGDSKLLRQIAECLAQCDPTSGLTAQYPMFSREHVSETLCGGYFPMLAVLTTERKGMQMMDRWRMINMMNHIIDLKQRPDLVKLLLSNFDYTLMGHPRVLLSKVLTAGTKDLRIHATHVLRKYATSRWAIQLLVTQLYDPELDVCAAAVKILEKACNNKSALEFIVECRPALDHLGEIGAPLLLRFLSTSIGYHYLDGLDYISNEMDDWFLGRNDSYVLLIEASLARAFVYNPDDGPANRTSLFGDDQLDADSDFLYSDAHNIPPHFYRELTRTQEGCRLLRDKGHFDEFASTIRDYGLLHDDPDNMTKVKGCLWAVGNVGAMELGAPFLEGCDVVQNIVRIAQEHQVPSMRGTAFFVMGLISRSTHGLEILAELGWESNTSPLGESLGFCIPKDLGTFFSLQTWPHHSVAEIRLPASQKTELKDPPPYIPTRPRSESLLSARSGAESEMTDGPVVELDPDPTNNRILELVIELGNMIGFKRAAAELMQLRQGHASSQAAQGSTPFKTNAQLQQQAAAVAAFRQPQLFRKVMSLLECHSYRLPIRRMVLEMFDKRVARMVVYGDDEEDEEDGDEPDVAPSGATSSTPMPTSQQETEDEESEPQESTLRPLPLQIRKQSEDHGRVGTDNHGGRATPREEDEEEDDDDDDEDSSGDEERTERQRSISDPADLQRDSRTRWGSIS